MGTDAYRKILPEYAADPACEGNELSFGDDETLETWTLAFLPVGIAGVKRVLRVDVVPGGAPLLLSNIL